MYMLMGERQETAQKYINVQPRQRATDVQAMTHPQHPPPSACASLPAPPVLASAPAPAAVPLPVRLRRLPLVRSSPAVETKARMERWTIVLGRVALEEFDDSALGVIMGMPSAIVFERKSYWNRVRWSEKRQGDVQASVESSWSIFPRWRIRR
jgi:hypothetical protein